MINFRKFFKGVNLRPKTTTDSNEQGDLEVLSTDGKIRYHDGTSNSPVVTEAHSQILTNKSIDADTNTITNIENADIKAGAAIARSKIAVGTADRILIDDGAGAIAELALTSAQIVVGSAGGVPTAVAVTGDISLSNAGVTAIGSGVVVDTDINASAAIARSKIAAGTASQVVVNDGSGNLSSTASVSAANGGTGLTTLTANNVLLGNGTSAVQLIAPSTSGNVLTSNGTTWASAAPAGGGGSSVRAINTQTGTTYTFALTDGSGNGNNPLVTLDNAAGVSATVPPNSSVAFAIGSQIDILQLGAGDVTFVAGSGVTINSPNGALVIDSRYSGVSLVKTGTNTWDLFGALLGDFIVATGGTITTDGVFKVHTFNSSGTFQITSGAGTVQSLVIGGGGGGGGGVGGGGGSGRMLYTTPGASYNVASYTVTVGAGGAGGVGGSGSSGSNSVFDSITSQGGGGGGGYDANGIAGGSGGGAGGSSNDSITETGGAAGGALSNAGGNNNGNAAGQNPSAGGGGAGAAGETVTVNTVAGNGGNGSSNSISGSAVTYAGGGGGSGLTSVTPGAGGSGGGGAGSTTAGTAGTANTGGGGGGSGVAVTGAAGGSGVVILRYRFQ